MLSSIFATVGAATLFPFASAFDTQGKANVAVYYGQGYKQSRLSHFCHETSLDIINLGFVNVFPDQGILGMPGTNFGNQRDGLTLSIGNVSTQFLTGCHQLAEDVPVCQAAGKKVFLSLGGDANQKIESEASAVKFADLLWSSFGPRSGGLSLLGSPRPFGDAVVDGFGFDIEQNGGFGYATMVHSLREHFAKEPSRMFYISGSPQCPIPDPRLGEAIANAAFDFVWVQFYNTQGCSAHNFVESNGNPGFNYDDWVTVIKNGGNPSAKLLVGLPASRDMAMEGFCLEPEEIEPLVAKYMGLYPETFGGIMLWEATASDRNRVHGRSYADNMKTILSKYGPTPSPSTLVSLSSTPAFSSIATPSSSQVSSMPSSIMTSTTMPAESSAPASISSSGVSHQSSFISPSKPTSSLLLTTGKHTPSNSAVSSTATGVRSSMRKSPSSPSTRAAKSGASTTSTVIGFRKPMPSSTISSGAPSSQTPSKHTGSGTSRTLSSARSTVSSTQRPGSVISTGDNRPTVTSESITVSASTTAKPEPTVTTVIVTSYIDICLTGFTTVTTTYTTTYCPATASASTTVPSPTDWTTAVTFCTHCAPTPTTVTLTLPKKKTTEDKSLPSSSRQPTGSASSPNHLNPTAIVTPVRTSSTRVESTGSSRSSSTVHVRPAVSVSVSLLPAAVAPIGTQETAPKAMFTGAAAQRVGGVGVGKGFAMVMGVALFVLT